MLSSALMQHCCFKSKSQKTDSEKLCSLLYTYFEHPIWNKKPPTDLCTPGFCWKQWIKLSRNVKPSKGANKSKRKGWEPKWGRGRWSLSFCDYYLGTSSHSKEARIHSSSMNTWSSYCTEVTESKNKEILMTRDDSHVVIYLTSGRQAGSSVFCLFQFPQIFKSLQLFLAISFSSHFLGVI